MVMRRWVANITHALLVLAIALGPVLALPAPANAATGPEKVVVGAYINDIQELDTERGSYTIDFYMWFRWKSPTVDPTDSIEVMNSNAMENTTSSSVGGVTGRPFPDAPIDMPDGSKYQGFRYQGVFSRNMDLHRFPFDTQQLTVILEDVNQDNRELQFVPDKGPVAISDQVTIPGFRIGTPTLSVTEHRYPTGFGDLRSPENATYSRIIVDVPVARDALPYLVKIMLPILIVILITSLIYLLPARLEDSRTGIGITAMLTMVALQWSTDSDLPSVDYLMMVDVIYILSMAYILIAMGYAVFASRRTTQESTEALLISLDRKVGITSLLLYAVVIATTVVYYVTRYHAGPFQ
ncbi:MAG: hypothetical protein KIH64_016670 [Mycobacterium sp.]|nr:hypothetical protein [Mycobacterium sp.]